mmetsp:Transcript_35976/g.88526  ORF Transcript_35976/g.88526 Transcript_35976/m.88526 type:complete len:228 (+) Transcript_35976:22-705(+)
MHHLGPLALLTVVGCLAPLAAAFSLPPSPITARLAPLSHGSRLSLRGPPSVARPTNRAVGALRMAGWADPERTERLLDAKAKCGKTFDQISKEIGLTNTYTTQLFLGQAQLKPARADALKKAVPGISDADLKAMQRAPMRGFDSEILKEPNVYRTYEAITHYGEAIKMLINEKCGDGIMSAIDFYLDVSTVQGKAGEQRVVLTFNGKFLPFIEQERDNNTAPGPDGP